MSINRALLPVTDREEREERLQKSRQCYQSIRRYGMADHYAEWQTKDKGNAPGVILVGNSKSGTPKKVFVKQYENIFLACHQDHDLLDLAVCSIVKKCGGRVPKVKLKGIADNHVYLFSGDIAGSQSKHPDRKYQYHEFSDDDVSVTTWSMVRSNHGIFSHKREFETDRISVARMLILGMILNIWDLHDENAGIVFSSEGNAKLAFVDFLIYVENIENENELDLDGWIRTYYEKMLLNKNFNGLISSLSLADYVAAFKKIAANFHEACGEAMGKIDSLTFIADKRKAKMSGYIKVWEQNFATIQKMVMKADQSPALFSKSK